MTPRPVTLLEQISQRYPEAFATSDRFRMGKGHCGLPDWPDLCFMPLAGFEAIVRNEHDPPKGALAPDLDRDVACLAALITWRATQGIYRFDPALYSEIMKADEARYEASEDIFMKLPEWCVYIETPDGLAAKHGFFAHIDVDVKNGAKELRLLLDNEDGLTPLAIPLGAWTTTEAMDKLDNEPTARDMAKSLAPLVVHLCLHGAGYGSEYLHRPADEPKVWQVGA